MLLHLPKCLYDYGPAHVTWLFAFEIYNGVLGSMPSNNHRVEAEFFRRHLYEQDMMFKDFSQAPDAMKVLHTSFLDTYNTDVIGNASSTLYKLATFSSPNFQCCDWSITHDLYADMKMSKCVKYAFDLRDHGLLVSLFHSLYSGKNNSSLWVQGLQKHQN